MNDTMSPYRTAEYAFDKDKNKNIIICCDGTWNSPKEKDEGKIAVTNVSKIYEAVRVAEYPVVASLATRQVRFYDAGVGADLGIWGKTLSWVGGYLAKNGGFNWLKKIGVYVEGATGLGVSENIKQAYTWLCKVYEPGDRIYLFGFSRGAFQVRSLSGLIYHCGLLWPDCADYADEQFERYHKLRSKGQKLDKTERAALREGKHPGATYDREKPLQLPMDNLKFMIHNPAEFTVHFLGVWDTVAALGLPLWGWSFELFRIRTSFHDTSLIPNIVNAYHALAMDEERSSFMPVLFDRPSDGSKNERFDQRWFRGAHADIGGGYARTGLSDITLAWMIDNARAAGLDLMPVNLKKDPLAPLHSQVAKSPMYAFAGLWPRMFPVPGLSTDHPLGEWHDSVIARQEKLGALTAGDPGWLTRLPLNQGWDLAGADPRERPWNILKNREESVPITIYSNRIWNPTGVVLEQGKRYLFRVVCRKSLPGNDRWVDLADSTDANGRSSWDTGFSIRRAFGWAKRMPSAPWMQLIGMINEPTAWKRRTLSAFWLFKYMLLADPRSLTGRQFPIGTSCVVTPRTSGPLYCFANDLWVAYGNNSGAITLKVKCNPTPEEIESIPSPPPEDYRSRMINKSSKVLFTVLGVVMSIIFATATLAGVSVAVLKIYPWVAGLTSKMLALAH